MCILITSKAKINDFEKFLFTLQLRGSFGAAAQLEKFSKVF